MNHEKILKSSPGLFGKISICETLDPAIRLMKINDEIEGQVFLEKDGNPGAITASRYLYAFIIPAWLNADKHGLVLGLGAGAGVTMLLALFPKLLLTVIEIDPQIIVFARRYFPLISFYENQGRLRIIQSDADTYLNYCQDQFAFTLLDLFSGDESNHHNLPLMNKVLKITPYFMANIITSKTMQPSISPFLNLENTSQLMWLRAYPAMAAEKINWIMTNINEISPEILDYRLFADLESVENIMTANSYFRYILSQVDAACFYR